MTKILYPLMLPQTESCSSNACRANQGFALSVRKSCKKNVLFGALGKRNHVIQTQWMPLGSYF